MNKPVVLEASLVVTPHRKRMMSIKEGFVPRERHPDEALPKQINVLAGDYEPPKDESPRPGADDHKQYKSRGFPC